MNFKHNLILLLLSVVVPSVVADGKKYDKATIKRKILSRTLCPYKYSAYVKNSTAQYENDVIICSDEETAEKLKLKESYEPMRKTLLHDSDSSCQTISECDVEGENVSASYDCMMQQSAKTATFMKNTSYKASLLQLDYSRQEQAIVYKKDACRNATTELLSDRTSAAIGELKHCYLDGKWTLPDIVPVLSQPTPAPAVSADAKQNVRQVETMKTIGEAAKPESENEKNTEM